MPIGFNDDRTRYDWRISSQLDVQKYKPQSILFQYHYLSETELSATRSFLRSNYHLFDAGIDIFAVREFVINKVSVIAS